MTVDEREVLIKLVILWGARADEEEDRDALNSEDLADALRVCSSEIYAAINSLPTEPR